MIGDNAAGQLLQQARHGQQKRRAEYIKYRVDNGYAQLINAAVQQGDVYQGPYRLKHRQPYHRADDVEGQMHHRRPAGVAVGTDGGKQGRNAGAYILTHDDGDSRAKGDLPCRRHGLQDTHGGRGGLDDGREHRACQYAQNGIGEHQQQLPEALHILQPRHGGTHGIHAEHQCGKAQKDQACILLLAALAHHIQRYTDQGQNRREGCRLEELHEKAVALDARKAQDPCRYSGAYVGTHNNINSLTQCHKAGVYKAHHHHRCGR